MLNTLCLNPDCVNWPVSVYHQILTCPSVDRETEKKGIFLKDYSSPENETEILFD